jgi:hypothetical protein
MLSLRMNYHIERLHEKNNVHFICFADGKKSWIIFNVKTQNIKK